MSERSRSATGALVRVVVAASTAGAALILSACASIPQSGSPREAKLDNAGDTLLASSILEARPPTPGMSPEELFCGFLIANGAFTDDDFATARSYLAKDAVWAPKHHALIFSDPHFVDPGRSASANPQPVQRNGGVPCAATPAPPGSAPQSATSATTVSDQAPRTLTLRITPRGIVDDDGHYQATTVASTPLVGYAPVPLASSAPRGAWDLRLTFVVEHGQWRIADPPAGVAVQDSLLGGAFARYQVWFATPPDSERVRTQVLVPDLVDLADSPDLLTELTKRLLAGPSVALAGAVDSGIPSGTTLLGGKVELESATAVVHLSSAALSATQAQRQLLAAQLVYTLTQVPGVADVRIDAGGTPLSAESVLARSDISSAFDPNAPGDSVPRALAVTPQGRLVAYDPGPPKPGWTPYDAFTLGNQAAAAKQRIARPAMSVDPSRVAALLVAAPSIPRATSGTSGRSGTSRPAPRAPAPRPAASSSPGAGSSGAQRRPVTGQLLVYDPRTGTTMTLPGAFTAPEFDGRGVLWSVSIDTGGLRDDNRVMALAYGDRTPYALQLPPELAGRVVTGVAPARDGVRVALVIRDQDARGTFVDDVYVASVLPPSGCGSAGGVCSSGGVATPGRLSFGHAVPVLTTSTAFGGSIRDLAWSNAATLAVLGAGTSPAKATVARVDIGQPTINPLDLTPDATSIAARPLAPDDEVVIATEGGLQTVSAKNALASFTTKADELTDPAFPG